MRAKWKDKSIYSKCDKDRIPTFLLLEEDYITLYIHREILYAPNQWFVSCREMHLDNRGLKSKDIEKAKLEALRIVIKHFKKVSQSLEKLDVKGTT